LSGGTTGSTTTATYSITAQFTEPVTGFADTDLSLTNATVSNFTPVDGDTYTFDVTAVGQGLVSVQVPAAKAKDAANNDNTASNALSWTYDTVAPTVTLSGGPLTAATSTPTYTITAQFSENVTGFVSGDLSLTNAT